MAPEDLHASGRAAFSSPDFILYEVSRFFTVLALEMQSVAVGWQVYEITRRPLDLGYVGLAQFLPGVLLFLFSGHAADRFNRRWLLLVCYLGFAACSGSLLTISHRGLASVYPIYGVLVVIGVVRSFTGPVSRAILPQLVREEHFQNAVAWNSGIFQAATIMGPSIGGLIYAFFRGPVEVYGAAMVASLLAAASTLKIRPLASREQPEELNLRTVSAGLRYVWRQKVILGSISLDMFAVLLGGAVALLPVYASEILKTGPWGLGLLRSAPGIGAGAMAIALAHRPLRRRVGAIMLWCVAGFGVFTIVFGLSRSIVLSMAALVLVGATDMVSVVIRGTLIQIATPDEMRGRVNAVDMLFIGVSNEFGQFESGVTAHWLGTVPAVVLGGMGTLVVIAIWAWRFPELRKADRLAAEELAGV
jgi:MFS family permease